MLYMSDAEGHHEDHLGILKYCRASQPKSIKDSSGCTKEGTWLDLDDTELY